MKRLKLKNGNILQTYIILLFIIILLVLIAYMVITQYYFTSKITSIRRDLFYIGQDAAKAALDISKLSYSEYEINTAKLNNVASSIIEKNYGSEVILDTIKFSPKENEVYIKVILKLKNFMPLGDKELSIPLEENMKLKLMEVE